jgi:hypothetical protein
MIASVVACAVARLSACERDLMTCEAADLSGSWAAAVRYIGLARRMLEAAEVPAVQSGQSLPTGSVARASLDRTKLSARRACRSSAGGGRELPSLPGPGQ